MLLQFWILVLASISVAVTGIQFVDDSGTEGDLDGAIICENTATGTQIYQLKTRDFEGDVTYSMFGDLSSYVSLDVNTGEITLIRQLDREQNEALEFSCEALDSLTGTTVTSNGEITIGNSNDEAPQITDLTYTEDIYEYPWSPSSLANVKISSDVILQKISIQESDILEITRSDATTYTIKLKSDGQLDYDVTPVVYASIYAEDISTSSGCDIPEKTLNSSLNLLLQLKDGPDKPPIFIVSPTSKTIPEDSTMGTEVCTFKAVDQDYSLNWKIRYEIEANDFFRIDEDNGTISLGKLIDRENDQEIFELKIKATELPENDNAFRSKQSEVNYPFTATTTIRIIISDVDDNLPKFYRLENPTNLDNKIETNEFLASLDEGTSIGSVVQGLNIYVEDIDQGSNAVFEVEIVEDGMPFELSDSTINGGSVINVVVTDYSELDYESDEKSFEFTIKASHEGNFTLARVRIQLNDTNDNSPEFTEDLINFNVSEDASIGDFVGKLEATDKDSGENGEVTYSIIIGGDLLTVEDNGEIRTKTEFDRERSSVHYVTFAAIDGGSRQTTVSAEINVLDVNDNSPEWQRKSYYGVFTDNDTTTEIEMGATDPDGEENQSLTFEIEDGPYAEYFSVSTVDGQVAILKPAKALDIEQIEATCAGRDKEIEINVVATDGKYEEPVTVSITIQDENEFPPEFSETNPKVVDIQEMSPSGKEVALIEAYDLDACSPNKDFDFSIGGIYSLDFNIIQLDDNKGSLQIRNSALDRDKQESYEVEVIATDLGTPRKSTSYFIIVNLLDVNNKSPQFVGSSLNEVSIAENATIDTVVATIIAEDQDANPDLLYSIENCGALDGFGDCDDWFNITTEFEDGKQAGKVKVLSENLDREKIERVGVTVAVEDLNANETFGLQRETGQLIISLIDVNDEKPIFQDSLDLVFEVVESQENAPIGQITATDADSGENGEIIYSVAETDQVYIKIGEDSGQLSTNKPLDRETMGSYYNATIIATDKGDPPLSSSTIVFIKIRDSNDKNPNITNLPAVKNVTEDESINKVIFTVQSFDEDEGRNAEIFYSLVETDLPFAINRTTGEIKITEELDYERVKSYKITVKASDNSAQLTLTDEATLTVNVEDVNDNPASFDQSSQVQSINIEEGPPGDTGVFIKPATDADSPTLQTNYYYVVGGTGETFFDIIKENGELTIIKEVDREVGSVYTLVIEVLENKNKVLRADSLNCDDVVDEDQYSCVTISVKDVNDEIPKFDKDEFYTDIPISSQPDDKVIVTQVYATDLDEDPILNYSITAQQICSSSCQNIEVEAFEVDQEDGNIFYVIQVDLESADYLILNLKVTDEIDEHSDTATLRIGLVSGNELVSLLSTFTREEFTAEKISDFERDLSELLEAIAVVDTVLSKEVAGNDAINSEITFHAKMEGTNELVTVDEIVKALDSATVESDQFLLTYGIIGRSIIENTTENENTLQIALIAVVAALALICVTLVVAVYCLKQRINRNKRVERAMEDTFDDLGKNKNHGMPDLNKRSENPLYDITENPHIITLDNPYGSMDDEIDDNSISIDNDQQSDQDKISVESVEDFQIDFASSGIDKQNLVAELNDATEGFENFGFEDTGF